MEKVKGRGHISPYKSEKKKEGSVKVIQSAPKTQFIEGEGFCSTLSVFSGGPKKKYTSRLNGDRGGQDLLSKSRANWSVRMSVLGWVVPPSCYQL